MRKKSVPSRFLFVAIATLLAAGPAIAEKGGHGKGGKPDKAYDKAERDYDKAQDKADRQYEKSMQKAAKKFDDAERKAIAKYYRDEYSGRGKCPPGLAKKNDGCMPPGKARKWYAGNRLPPEVYIAPLPPALVGTLVAPMAGYNYGYVDGEVVLFGVADRVVIDVVVLF